MIPIAFLLLVVILLVFCAVYWPPFVLLHRSHKSIDEYEKAAKLVWIAPRHSVWMVMWFFKLTVAFVAAVLGLLELPASGFIDSELQLVIIILFVLNISFSHYYLVAVHDRRSDAAMLLTSVLIFATALAIAIMSIWACSIPPMALWFALTAIDIAVVAVSMMWWLKNPRHIEAKHYKKVTTEEYASGQPIRFRVQTTN